MCVCVIELFDKLFISLLDNVERNSFIYIFIYTYVTGITIFLVFFCFRIYGVD